MSEHHQTVAAVDDEAKLLTQLQSLDSEALTRVYNRYQTQLYRYISFQVDDQQTAEDLTSEVFTRLITAIQRGRAPRDTLKGWLFGVAGHVVKDHFRRKSRWRWTTLTDYLTDSADSLDQQLSQIMTNEQLRANLKKLTTVQQQVLALRFGSGLPIKEVAEILGKSESAVKMLQARAVAALSRVMTNES